MTLLEAEDFEAARRLIQDRIHRTPVLSSSTLSRETGYDITFKCENLQKTGSFKVRGVLNRLEHLSDGAGETGVVTISAGNHAAALAWAAGVMGVPCTVVMPARANPAKVAATRAYGADVVLHGTVDQAFSKTHELERERGLELIHPFDDPLIIAGHGSVGLEILEDIESIECVVVPVGGGGLVSGIAGAIKTRNPHVAVYGVEPEGAAAMTLSIQKGAPQRVTVAPTVADGLAPPMAGKLNYEYVSRFVDGMVTVTDDEIVAALDLILSRTKLVVEPSGAASFAAVLHGKLPVPPHRRMACVLSGGNTNLAQLRQLGAG